MCEMGLIKIELVGNQNNFWNAIEIYCRYPNSINKEVLYSEIICCAQNMSSKHLSDMECQNICYKIYGYFFVDKKHSKDIIYALQNEYQLKLLDSCNVFSALNNNCIIIRRLLPKKTCYSNQEFYEVCFLDKQKKTVRIHTLFNENHHMVAADGEKREYDPFVIVKFNKVIIYYENNYLHVEYDDDLSEKGVNWINSVFVTKLTKLFLSGSSQNNAQLCFSSQIDVIKYYKLYERMKLKYAKHLIENWSENTDPHKFIFEDIGIATYLLLLWNNGEIPNGTSERQKFVDLGCGNGLLVYILNSEGHNGVGLDIRKRKIWDTYPPYVILKEEAVVPGPSSQYPDTDWLIGNHSDELTPWLPVMARRSAPNCQYFVLPCCPYELNGQLYQRKNSGLSIYHDFIHYVRGISEICEFDTFIDKLRIPSTKRICIIGKKRRLTDEEMESLQKRIDLYIMKQLPHNVKDRNINLGNSDKWIPEFKVRQRVETVRNCTKLPKEVITEIVLSIANHLLKEKNILIIAKENGVCQWNQGGGIPITEIAKTLTQEQLKYLKNECKGLQTLIKNHHYVFHVSGGVVRLRNNVEMMSISQRNVKERYKFKWKQKNCWFFANHPDSCPLEDSACSYRHE